MALPKVWNENFSDHLDRGLKLEAAVKFRIFQLPDTLKEWEKAKKVLRQKIWANLGVTPPDHKLPLKLRVTGEVKMDGYTVKKIVYQSRPGFFVTGNLYVPTGKGPFPAAVNMHGHWFEGRLAERVQERGHTLAQNGYVALCVDAFGAGERTTVHGQFEYHGSSLGGSLMNIGETLMGIQVVDNMRGVDLLCSLNYVDAEKIGATGASGGGNQTMWLTALDDRIKAAVPVVSVGTFESYVTASNCVCELLPNGLTFTEESGVLALVAPRALKICNALGDANPTFFPSEMLRSFKEARKVFQLYHADDKLSYRVFHAPHGYWPEVRETMLGWFDLHLKGIGHGAPKQELPFKTLSQEQVMCFESGKRPGEVQSIAEYCRGQGNALKKTFLDKSKFKAPEERAKLAAILKISGPLQLQETFEHAPCNFEGRKWRRISLATTNGRLIPLLLTAPTGKSRQYHILVDSCDKNNLADSCLLQKALKSGDGVVVADLFGQGETYKEAKPGIRSNFHDLTRAEIWMGRTLMGKWVTELQFIGEFIKKQEKSGAVILGGREDGGIAALFCAALHPEYAAVKLSFAPVSFIFGEKAPPFTMALLLPGILGWGDVSLAAALADNKVEFIVPRRFDGEPVAAKEFAALQKEYAAVAKKCGTKSKVEFSA